MTSINIIDLGKTIRLDYGDGKVDDLTKGEIDNISAIPLPDFVGVDDHGKEDGFYFVNEGYVNLSRDLKAQSMDIKIKPEQVSNFIVATVADLYTLLSGMFDSNGSNYHVFTVGVDGQDGDSFNYLPYFPYNNNILVFVNGAIQTGGYTNETSAKVIFDSTLPDSTEVVIVSL